MFCEMLASAVDMPVRGGPVEAAAVGNILSQAIAYGKIKNIDEGRRLVERGMDIREFEPEGGKDWTEAKERMKELLRS